MMPGRLGDHQGSFTLSLRS